MKQPKPKNRPRHDIRPSKKGKAHSLKMIQHILDQYQKGMCAVSGGCQGGKKTTGASYGERPISVLRSYAKGTQAIDKYKKLYNCWAEKKASNKDPFKTFFNISWDTPKVLAKFRDIAVNAITKQELSYEVRSFDPAAAIELQKKKAKLQIGMHPKIQELKQLMGMPTNPHNLFEYDDIDALEEAGEIRLEAEAGFTGLIEESSNNSDHDTIYRKNVYDLIDIGIGAKEDEVNPNTGLGELIYIDIKHLICPTSQYQDFRDIDYAGYFKRYTSAELRRFGFNANHFSSNTGKEQYIDQTDEGTSSNRREENHNGYENCGDHWGVKLYWLTSDYDRWTEYEVNGITHRDDSMWWEESDEWKQNYERELTDSIKSSFDNAEEVMIGEVRYLQTKQQYVYQAEHILGTMLVFNNGKSRYQGRKGILGARKSMLPIHIERVETTSFVERCISFVDDICMDVFKLRHVKSKIPPGPRLAIDKKVLEGIKLGGVEVTPKQLLKMFGDIGVLLYETTSEVGMPLANGIGKPIEQLTGNWYSDVDSLRREINFSINEIRMVTGINEITDASSPNRDQLVGVSNIAIQQTNNAIHHNYVAALNLSKNAFNGLIHRIQAVLRTRNLKARFSRLGDTGFEIIKLTANNTAHDLGINIKAKMTKEEKSVLLQEILTLKATREQGGVGGIDVPTYFMLKRYIDGGNFRLAELAISRALRKQEKRDKEAAQANTDRAIQQNAAAAQTKGEEERKTLQMKLQADLQIEERKHVHRVVERGMDKYGDFFLKQYTEQGKFDQQPPAQILGPQPEQTA